MCRKLLEAHAVRFRRTAGRGSVAAFGLAGHGSDGRTALISNQDWDTALETDAIRTLSHRPNSLSPFILGDIRSKDSNKKFIDIEIRTVL